MMLQSSGNPLDMVDHACGSRLILILVAAVALVGPSCTNEPDWQRPNVILIVVDAMRPDHLGCYGYGRPTSPNIDSLAAEGVLFTNAISHAPWTKGSFSCMLTSLYPFQHGAVGWESVLSESLVTLPELLQERGYHTMALLSIATLSGRYQVMQGIQEIREPRLAASGTAKLTAEDLTEEAIELIGKCSGPFFTIIHYYDAHEPYCPPEEYIRMVLTESDISELEDLEGRTVSSGTMAQEVRRRQAIILYDAGIRYVDDQIGKILTYLDRKGLTEETLLIVTADHGEAFGEHGVWAHAVDLHDEAIRVPLILRSARQYRGGIKIDVQTGHVDLLPSIAELAGAVDQQHREGLSLRELIEKGRRTRKPGTTLPAGVLLSESTLREALTQKSLRTVSWKMLVEPATGQIRLYDLIDDPGETRNIWGRRTPLVDSLVTLMNAIPGSSLGGWRIAFTGRPHKTTFKAEISVGNGERLTGVRELTRGAGLSMEITDDSTGFGIEVVPRPTRLVWFDCEPYTNEILIRITSEGSEVPEFAWVGSKGKTAIEKTLALKPSDAHGLPDAFTEFRRSGTPGVYIWWLPGERPGPRGRAVDLTPEEKQHLRALGYIQ
jgi:choline-sulfatase